MRPKWTAKVLAACTRPLVQLGVASRLLFAFLGISGIAVLSAIAAMYSLREWQRARPHHRATDFVSACLTGSAAAGQADCCCGACVALRCLASRPRRAIPNIEKTFRPQHNTRWT